MYYVYFFIYHNMRNYEDFFTPLYVNMQFLSQVKLHSNEGNKSKSYLNSGLYSRVKFWRNRQVCFRSLLADLIAGSTNVPSCVLSVHAANLH